MGSIFITENDDFILWLWKEGYITEATDKASKEEIDSEYLYELWKEFYKEYRK